jgi:hypothetical protein
MTSFPDGWSDGRVAGPPRRAGLAAIAVACVLAAGCSSGASSPGGPGPTATPPAVSPSASLELESPKAPSGTDQTYTGVLRSDAIEGGCVYLQAADGTKYELIAPTGWEIQKAPAAVVDPSGKVVARAGQVITVDGHEADMMSICQVGPIIQAIEITAGGASS